MEDTIDMYEILDTAVKDITKKVAKLELQSIGASEIDSCNSSSLVTTTQGDYILTIVFHTSDLVLKEITQNMKRGRAVEEGDIAIYAAEYFNILCGHVISNMNRMAHTVARFSIPKVVKGGYQEDMASGRKRQALFYGCSSGTVKVETFFQLMDDA